MSRKQPQQRTQQHLGSVPNRAGDSLDDTKQCFASVGGEMWNNTHSCWPDRDRRVGEKPLGRLSAQWKLRGHPVTAERWPPRSALSSAPLSTCLQCSHRDGLGWITALTLHDVILTSQECTLVIPNSTLITVIDLPSRNLFETFFNLFIFQPVQPFQGTSRFTIYVKHLGRSHNTEMCYRRVFK